MALFANNIAKPPWNVRDIGKAALLAILFFSAATAAIVVAFLLPLPESALGFLEYHLSSLLLYAGMLGCVWYFSLSKYGVTWATLGFRRTTAPHLLVLPPMALALNLGFATAYTALVSLLGIDALIPEQDIGDLLTEAPLKPLIYLDIALLGPIVEEIVFRGFILAGFIATLGSMRGVLISSALFAALHFDLDIMPIVFISGILFAWLYLRTGSIWPPIAAHTLQNSLATLQIELIG